jgi:hypothetical protein
MADPNVTDRCPRGGRCESCGNNGGGLQIKVIEVLGASMCLTLCPGCAASGRAPSIMLSTAQKLVEQHRQHLAGPDRPTYRPAP